MLTQDQIQLIRNSAQQLAASDVSVTSQFYLKLFAEAPSVRPLFPEDMFGQSEKLWASILSVINTIDDLYSMQPVLAKMGQRHIGYGAEIAHYELVKSVLLSTMASFLGDDWTESVHEAWEEALTFVVDAMCSEIRVS